MNRATTAKLATCAAWVLGSILLGSGVTQLCTVPSHLAGDTSMGGLVGTYYAMGVIRLGGGVAFFFRRTRRLVAILVVTFMAAAYSMRFGSLRLTLALVWPLLAFLAAFLVACAPPPAPKPPSVPRGISC